MTRLSRAFDISLVACSIPAAVIALAATLGAALNWGGLGFASPTYYLTLAIAAWCPVSKLVVWRLWGREAPFCPTCLPAQAIERRLSSMTETESAADRRLSLCTEE